jgi:hypothetical protein
MQFMLDVVSIGILIGYILSVTFILVFLILWTIRDTISSVPLMYSVGSLLVIQVGCTYVVGETGFPLHTQIGLFGGYFLLLLALIQVYYEIFRKKLEQTE